MPLARLVGAFVWASAGACVASGALQARPTRATDEPTRGVWGWTNGEMTYLRVRPSKTDPAVAKVSHATRVFVWGKYNGWYRVETPDHKFGWVYHDFLTCPKAYRVETLTHRKAAAASDKASRQTLYGSKSTLQSYYVRHRASGAAKGLAQHGVRVGSSARLARASRASKASKLAQKPAPKRIAARPAAKPAARISAARPAISRTAISRTAVARTVARPIASAKIAKPSARLASVASQRLVWGSEPRRASGAHFAIRQTTRGYGSPTEPLGTQGNPGIVGAEGLSAGVQNNASGDLMVLDPVAPPASVKARPKASVEAPRLAARPAARPVVARIKVVARPIAKSVARVKPVAKPAPRVALRPVARLAAGPAVRPAVRPAPRLWPLDAPAKARVASPSFASSIAPSPAITSASMRLAATESVAPAAAQFSGAPAMVAAPSVEASAATAPVAPAKKVGKPASKAVVKVAAKASKPQLPAWKVRAQARARARQQRQLWAAKQRQTRSQRRLASRSGSRNNLRSRMSNGTVPRMGLPPLVRSTRPISPDELMRARDAHLATSPAAVDAADARAGAPDATEPELFTPSGFSGGSARPQPSSGFLQSFQQSFQRSDALLTPIVYTSGATPRSPQNDDRRWAQRDEAASAPKPSSIAASSASRGGSPRDRVLRSSKVQKASRTSTIISSRGPSVGKVYRGGSRRDLMYARRGGSPRDLYAQQRRASGGSLFGQTLASQALAYRGTPYRSGGASPRGFDCSGLVYFLLRQRGFNPPRTAAGLASFGRSVPKDQLEAGDIVLFANTYKRGVSHVGIYQGEGKFVHAPHSGSRVRTDVLFSGYYNAKYWGARRPK